MLYMFAAGILLIRIQQFLMLSSYNLETGNIQKITLKLIQPRFPFQEFSFNMNNVIKTARTTQY